MADETKPELVIPDTLPFMLGGEAQEKEAAVLAILGGGAQGRKHMDGLPKTQRALLIAYLTDRAEGRSSTWNELCDKVGCSYPMSSVLKQSKAWDAVNRWMLRRDLNAIAERRGNIVKRVLDQAESGDVESQKLVFKAGKLLDADVVVMAAVAPVVIVDKFRDRMKQAGDIEASPE